MNYAFNRRNKYLVNLVFSVCNVKYGSSFFPLIHGPRASRLGHKSAGKTQSAFYRTELQLERDIMLGKYNADERYIMLGENDTGFDLK